MDIAEFALQNSKEYQFRILPGCKGVRQPISHTTNANRTTKERLLQFV